MGPGILRSELDQTVRQQRQLGRDRTTQQPQQLALRLRQFRDLQGGLRQRVQPILQLHAHLFAVRVKRFAAGQPLRELDAHDGANGLEHDALFASQFRVSRLVFARMLGHFHQRLSHLRIAHRCP